LGGRLALFPHPPHLGQGLGERGDDDLAFDGDAVDTFFARGADAGFAGFEHEAGRFEADVDVFVLQRFGEDMDGPGGEGLEGVGGAIAQGFTAGGEGGAEVVVVVAPGV
jgi:hypothetical protein